MNERDALIAAVKAQVEKEKAAKAARLAKEQEMQQQVSGKPNPTQTTQKFRPWNPDEDKLKKEEKAAEPKPAEAAPKKEPEPVPQNKAEEPAEVQA